MRIENLSFAYGEKKIFQDLNMDMPKGVTCIMGGSGVGKTTLLNCISRQLNFDGSISCDGKGIAYVFQSPRLIPSMSVEDNISYVLPRNIAKEEVKKRVDDVITKLNLADCRKSYPKAISGGQAGRVALARALVTDAQVLLLDEPFKGIDIKLKRDILNLLIPLIQNKCVVFVTHDVEEALAIADRVFVFERQENAAVTVKGSVDIMQNQAERDVYGEYLNKVRKEINKLLIE